MNLRAALAAFTAALALVAATLPSAALARQNVLLVFDEDKELPGLAAIHRGLREVFRAELKDDVELYSESLNLSQFRDPHYQQRLREHFRRKYADKRPDLIVAVLQPSLAFLLRQGEDVFPRVPIVFCGVDPSDIDRRVLRPNVTGLLLERDFAPTLDIALRLQPATQNVFVVGGTSGFDRGLQAIARRHLQPFEGRVSLSWLTDLPMNALLKKVSELPPHSVIYYLTVFADGAGVPATPHETLARVTRVANAPVYVSVDQFVGSGAVGGNVYSVATHGEQAAQIAVRVLRGEAPSSIPVVAAAAQSNLFDWRALHRWGIDEARLPPGSTVDFRSPSVWQLYKWYVLAGVSLILLQSALVIGLLANRAQRRRAEDETRRQRDELAHAQRLATLGELTASFAHELSQPLTAVTANAQAARRMFAADNAQSEMEEVLDDIARDALRATETFRRIRALFRKEPSEHVRVDLNALIDDVLQLFTANLKHRYIRIAFVRGEGLPAVLGDAVQLRQVVVNLLVNAEDAISLAGDGPREIRIETRHARGAFVEVDIRDSGVGMKEDDLERLFERFVSTKPQGLGLGLAISRSIVDAHGGRIWATRNEDRGITMHIELPAPPG